MSLQLLVILVPVLFGLMGFAFDLGRMYLIRGELNQAASAMALAAASRLTGTVQALDAATTAAQELLDDTTGHGARYNFGADLIGQTTGLLSSQVSDPAFFATYADATGTGTGLGTQADGTTARHVQVSVTADAPLLFWSFLSLGQQRSTPVAGLAVAGISAPVCVACGIEPLAVAAISTSDTTDFGFTAMTYYTFAYQCTANPPNNPPPAPVNGTVVNYILLDHYDASNTADETQQLYRIGASGLIPSPTRALACSAIGNQEAAWGLTYGGTSAVPQLCGTSVPSPARDMLCGLYSRLDTTQTAPAACSVVTDADTLAAAYPPDTDTTDQSDYTAYTGNTRRVMTVPIVDSLSDPTTMTILGFRQFLLEPTPNDPNNDFNPADLWGRFVALYIGMSPADNNTTPVPVKQGEISGCTNGAPAGQGPGKVVLHQ